MALQAVETQLLQREVLGCNSSSSKVMGETGCVATSDAGYAGKSTRVCQLPSATDRIDSKTPARNASRKKSRNKAKPTRMITEKIYPEELLVDSCIDNESESSYRSPQETIGAEAISFVDCRKFSETNVPNSKQCVECSRFGIYDKKSYLQCNICNYKPSVSTKCEFEASESCHGKSTQAVTRCASLSNVQAVQSNCGAFLSNDMKKTQNNFHHMRKKDQSRLTWQRCQRGRSSMQGERAGLSLPSHANFETSSFPIQQQPFGGEELSVTKQNVAVLEGIYVDFSVQSSPEVAQSCEIYPPVSQAKQMGAIHSVTMDKSDANLTNFGQCRSNTWRTTQSHGSKSDRFQYRSGPSQMELLQKRFPYGAKFNSKDRGTFDAIQPCIWMKLPRVKPVEENTFYHFGEEEWKSNFPCRIQHGQGVTQQPSSRKWIPVCKKKVKIPKSIVSVETCDKNNSSPSGKNGVHLEDNLIPLCATDLPSGLSSTNLISPQELTSLVEKVTEIKNLEVEAQKVEIGQDFHKTLHVAEGFQHLFINAQMVERAFSASYRLQVASETVEQATGYPIADFERLLCSATPYITSSVSSESFDGCLHHQLCSPSLCRGQIPNISLHAIWNWYEEPGNYGLKVNVDDPQNQKGCIADKVSVHAHFVPLLSAVQLFGYQHMSSSCNNSAQCSLKINGKEAKLQPSHGNPIPTSATKASMMGDTLVDKVNSRATHNSSDVYTHDGNEPLNVAPPVSISNADLIFEFFESEQPQRRMPLRNKIMELASGGTANNQVSGDPSKLECMNLDDLHPASWFSVAWYPVYRIPEGKLRAAFLTYHSLGYLVQRCMANNSPEKSTLGVVLPIIGLQSYNTQGELWFAPNPEVESSFSELSSVLLKERLGTLEDNALLFARGMVSRDHATVTNRQPDYEFFMSRKH